MSVAGDGLTIDEEAVEHIETRVPTRSASSAAACASRLPSGHLFGSSPAASTLAEMWGLAADHHKEVTRRLEEDLVALRAGMRTARRNVAESQADAAVEYEAIARPLADHIESSADDISTFTDGYRAERPSAEAEELAGQSELAGEDPADGGDAAGGNADGGDAGGANAAAGSDGPAAGSDGEGSPYGPSTSAPGATTSELPTPPAPANGSGPYG